MAIQESITLLHVSDMQFGCNHRFGAPAAGDGDAELDTLFSRLGADVRRLTDDDPSLAPQAIVISGDLAEWGRPSEFRDAREFLERLCASTGVARRNVVVVPGNHDVSRGLSEAYFAECEANETKPVPPFARKWEHYLRMLQDFYGGERQVDFTVEEPWMLLEIEELNLVVAGLNSTMRESHRDDDHYGWVGEAQLRWFEERLAPFVQRGWFRLGVVHHNAQRGAQLDDENLRDADDLVAYLSSSLNLLLHGHTHDCKLGWLGEQALPVLSTGSAALRPEGRPPEVPNQYQFVRLRSDGIERWTRRYDPGNRRWVGDTTCTARGDAWHLLHDIAFQHVSGAFGGEAPGADRDVEGKHKTSEIERARGFVDRVLEICELRHGGEATRIDAIHDLRHPYLRVRACEAGVAQSFPIGLVEGNVGTTVVDGFCREVFDHYRALDQNLRCAIVYGGDRASEELVRYAAARNVDLRSFVELQGIIDFRGYVERQTARLTSDVGYLPSLYVPQQMNYEVAGQRFTSTDALGDLMSWLQEPRARFVLVLGDFGTGKTFLLRELARQMPTQIPHLTPVLIELRSLEKARTLEQLVAQHLATAGERFIDLNAFPYMLREGRIALLFDGFDELATRVTYRRAAEHFETLVQAAGGDAKVVVTSRTQHFESDQQAHSALLDRAAVLPGLSLCRVQPFDDAQILTFLERHLGDPREAQERFELIDEIKDLLGLSHNPRMLGFIASIPEERLRKAREHTGGITAAGLYELLIDQWLSYEEDKTQPLGAAPTLARDPMWAALTSLALALWTKIDGTIHVSELTEQVSATVERLSVDAREGAAPDADAIAHLVGSRTLLVRDEEGAFSFVHGSVMEWFVADEVAQRLLAGEEPLALSLREMTALMVDFVCDLAGEEAAAEWAAASVSDGDGSAAGANALLILRRLGREVDHASLAGESLGGHDLSAGHLSNARLAGVDLTEARLAGAELAGADLRGASLVRADLTGANLTGATLDDADADGARMLGSDLRDASLRGTSLRRAKLVGAILSDPDALSGSDTFGAALPDADRAEPVVMPVAGSTARSIAVHPSGELVASGYSDGTVRLWDLETANGLRMLAGHRDWVRAVAFSADGRLLASGSDDRTVRVWDVASGRLLTRFTEPHNWVRALAFSPDGSLLACGGDAAVHLWDLTGGDQRVELIGASVWVHSLAFTSDGTGLVGIDELSSVHRWQIAAPEQLPLSRHAEGTAMAVSPDGRLVADAIQDAIGIIDVETARRLGMLEVGHRIASAAFSSDGTLLVTSDRRSTVRVWDWAAGTMLREHAGPGAAISKALFAPDDETIVAAGESAIHIWNAATGMRTMQGSARDAIRTIAFASELVVGYRAGVGVWDPTTGEVNDSQSLGVGLLAALTPDGRTLVSGPHELQVHDVASGNLLWTIDDPQSRTTALAVSRDGAWLAVGGDAGEVKTWNLHERSPAQAIRPYAESAVLALAFSHDGALLACGSENEAILVYDAHGVPVLRSLPDDTVPCMALGFSSWGRLASAGQDGLVRLWDPTAGVLERVLPGHEDWVRAVAFSPDGRLLASGSDDLTVRLWDPLNGKPRHVRVGHQGWVRDVVFSPDGRLLASTADDRTVRLWDVETGTLLATLVYLSEGYVAFTPDGRYRVHGRTGGSFWYAIGLCRFAPGELDEVLPPGTLRRLGRGEPLRW